MKILKKIDSGAEKIESVVCLVAFLGMIIVVIWSVLCRRNIIPLQFVAGEELTRYLTIYAIFFGTGLAMKNKAHVGIEAVVNVLPLRAKWYVKLVAEILTCVIFAVLLYFSVKMLLQYNNSGQLTTITRIPMTFVYLCVPCGMFLSLLHGVIYIVRMVTGDIDREAVTG